jgi:TRAP-type uncharacterized transport system fused permease subunit
MEPEERESAYRSYGGIIGLALMSVAILWILFHVVTAGIGTLPNYQQRAIIWAARWRWFSCSIRGRGAIRPCTASAT